MISLVNNFDELIEVMKKELAKGNIPFCVSAGMDSKNLDKDKVEFEELLCQEINRTINNQESEFLAIRSVKLHPHLRGKNKFKEFFKEFDKLPVNKMFQDVVNPNLQKFLINNGYKVMTEMKYDSQVINCYKLVQQCFGNSNLLLNNLSLLIYLSF